jgi:hypothetical protein
MTNQAGSRLRWPEAFKAAKLNPQESELRVWPHFGPIGSLSHRTPRAPATRRRSIVRSAVITTSHDSMASAWRDLIDQLTPKQVEKLSGMEPQFTRSAPRNRRGAPRWVVHGPPQFIRLQRPRHRSLAPHRRRRRLCLGQARSPSGPDRPTRRPGQAIAGDRP